LLPLGIVFLHSDWPPLEWKHTHVASGNIGSEEILPVSVLFLLFSFVYFIFPKVFRRRMNRTLSWLHFWANMAFLIFAAAGPIFQNLTLPMHPNQSFWERFSEGFGAGLEFFIWEIAGLLAIQLFFAANLVWSISKGERILSPAHRQA